MRVFSKHTLIKEFSNDIFELHMRRLIKGKNYDLITC